MSDNTSLFNDCRKLYDKLRHDMGGMDPQKKLGMVNALLGQELIMSLMINEEYGDLLMLQIRGRSVRVFADPTKWGGREIENGTKAEVASFLRGVERRRQALRRSGRHGRR